MFEQTRDTRVCFLFLSSFSTLLFRNTHTHTQHISKFPLCFVLSLCPSSLYRSTMELGTDSTLPDPSSWPRIEVSFIFELREIPRRRKSAAVPLSSSFHTLFSSRVILTTSPGRERSGTNMAPSRRVVRD